MAAMFLFLSVQIFFVQFVIALGVSGIHAIVAIMAIVSIAVTIAVAIAVVIATVFTVFAIAVGTFLVDAVDDDVDLHSTVFDVFDHASEDVLVGDALTDAIDIGVGLLHQQVSVGHKAQRRGVDDDVVISFLEQTEQLCGFVGSDELSRVGRDRS